MGGDSEKGLPAETIQARLDSMSIPEPNTGSLLWTGSLDGRGYPKITADKRTLRATRVSYETNKGPLLPGKMACHKCDVSCCIEPSHLFPGTHLENMADLRAKGLALFATVGGIRPDYTRITEETARAILADRRPQRQIAAAFAVSKSLVADIKRGARWSHLQ